MHTPITIPIRSFMTEADEDFDYLPMPRDMSTFAMPRPPEPGPGLDVGGAHDLLKAFCTQLSDWLERGGEQPAVELRGLPAQTLRVLNETLGEGEVSAIVGGGTDLRVQETVFAGVWREQHFAADGVLEHDFLLASPVPEVLPAIARQEAQARLRALPLPAGAMNLPPLLHELQEAMDACETQLQAGMALPPHVINLTLLPLSLDDGKHLDALLEGGAVVILSRGFGNCRISSTAARHVWRVQYFNNMQTLILNTLEVVGLPEAALAAREDLLETRDRLVELVQWMGESLAPA
jgi:hydrogenase-1 operon protein HyaF